MKRRERCAIELNGDAADIAKILCVLPRSHIGGDKHELILSWTADQAAFGERLSYLRAPADFLQHCHETMSVRVQIFEVSSRAVCFQDLDIQS